MSATWAHIEAVSPGSSNQDYDDAERGMYDSSLSLPVVPRSAFLNEKKRPLNIDTTLSITSPIHEGITPFSSVPELSLSWPKGFKVPNNIVTTKKAPGPKPKISRLIRFKLWFNTYRKFFTFCTLLNLTGIILAALGRFPYAENHLGALVLGNLLCAILMRNELFLRFLYMIAIYGLRGVSLQSNRRRVFADQCIPVGPSEHQVRGHFGPATCRRYPFRMRTFRLRVSLTIGTQTERC